MPGSNSDARSAATTVARLRSIDDDDARSRRRPTRRVDQSGALADQPLDRLPDDHEARDHEDRGLGERAQVLRLAVPVRWPGSAGRPATPTAKKVSRAPRRGRSRSGSPRRRGRGCSIASPAPSLTRSARRQRRPRSARCDAGGSPFQSLRRAGRGRRGESYTQSCSPCASGRDSSFFSVLFSI